MVKEQILNQGELVELPFHGVSMWPTLKPGDLLLVSLRENREGQSLSFELNAGDIVIERDSEEWVAHRIIFLSQEKGLALKGDRSNNYSLLSRDKKVWGKVCGYQRGSKRIMFSKKSFFVSTWIAWLSRRSLSFNGISRKVIKASIIGCSLLNR